MSLGLQGQSDSTQRRAKLLEKLQLPVMNAKKIIQDAQYDAY